MSSDAGTFTPAVFPRIARRSAAAEREFEAARIRGYAAGHAAGMRAAGEAVALIREELAHEREQEREQSQRRLAGALAALATAVARLDRRERELAEAGHRTLERLAVELAEAIVGRELRTADDAPLAAVRRALADVDAGEVRELRLHPDDLDAVREAGTTIDEVALRPDPSLAPGDAVAVLGDGVVDARVAAAFERARRALEAGGRS